MQMCVQKASVYRLWEENSFVYIVSFLCMLAENAKNTRIGDQFTVCHGNLSKLAVEMLTKTCRRRFGQELFRLTAYITFFTFYYFFVEDDGDVILTTPLKCGPIVSLGIYVYFKGFKFTNEFRYSHLIMGGLIFSCIGDFLLNLDLFPHGMASFAIAQAFYITAFKLKPLMIHIGIPLYLLAGGMVAYVFNSMDTVIKIGLPIYGVLLITMCWRCIVRAIVRGGVLAPFCALGSVLFVVSDTLICVNMFISPIPKARVIIMTTYYVAQLLISISTMSDVLKPKKAKGSKKLSRKFRDQD